MNHESACALWTALCRDEDFGLDGVTAYHMEWLGIAALACDVPTGVHSGSGELARRNRSAVAAFLRGWADALEDAPKPRGIDQVMLTAQQDSEGGDRVCQCGHPARRHTSYVDTMMQRTSYTRCQISGCKCNAFVRGREQS